MPRTLQSWTALMAYNDAGQARFLLRDIEPLVFATYGYPLADSAQQLSMVISSHTSKSVELPVVQMRRPDLGLVLTMRNNFYDWKLSVSTLKPFRADFTGLFFEYPPRDPSWTGDCLSSVYFEGFPEDLVYGYRGNGLTAKWSASIGPDSDFLFVIRTILRAVDPPKRLLQSTRKESAAKTIITIAAERKLSPLQLRRLGEKHHALFRMSEHSPQFLASNPEYTPVEGCRAENQGIALASVSNRDMRFRLLNAQKDIAVALARTVSPRKKAKACEECDGDRVVAEGEGAQTYFAACPKCSVLVET